jgi:hypothetical protein
VVDNTMLNDFRSCPQKAYLAFVQHWKPQRQSIHLHAGKAFADGLERARRSFFEGGFASGDAVVHGVRALLESYGDFECPPESAKSAENMVRALEYYFSTWPLGTDGADPLLLPSGKRAIEFSFIEPLPIAHPETGEPILYSGRSDMICRWNNGIFVEDDKTTSSLGSNWGDQWELRSQFTGYSWAARRTGIEVDGVLVRGVAILKTMTKAAQHITFRPQWEIDRWLSQTVSDLHRMIQCWKDGWWDWNLGESCANYGGCHFLQVCKSQNPAEWLPMYFQQRKWDPITRTETVL